MNGQARRLLAMLLLAVWLAPLPPARACLTVGPPRPDVHVQVADETAVIVWDARTQTEHFIRHATFETNAADFGFLVPTPKPPVLAQARAEAFERLDTLIQPRVEVRTRRFLQPTLLLGSCMHGMVGSKQTAGTTASVQTTAVAPPAPSVSVLSTQHLGRYDATVLKASDAGALARWLNAHGYAARPAVRDWLAPYVAGGWAVTAFKIAKDAPGDTEAGSSVVRMSFHTPRPFFPDREPADQRTPGVAYPPRLLRVFLLAGQRLDPGLGPAGASWPGRTVWSDALPDAQRTDLNDELALPPNSLPPGLRLTTVEDRSSPRPGVDDLYFRPAPDQAVVRPAPVIDWHDAPIPLPLDLLLLMAVILVRVVLRARQAGKRGWA